MDGWRVDFVNCMQSAGLPVELLIEYFGLVQLGKQMTEASKEI